MKVELQFASSKKKSWVSLANYNLRITEDMFSSKSTWTVYDKRIEALRKHDSSSI
jgi:hypothetical protein